MEMSKDSTDRESGGVERDLSESKHTPGAMRAARTLRIKIHGLESGSGVHGADNPANSKWLDDVCTDDAQIIDQETAAPELLEALEKIARMEPGSRGAYAKFAEAVKISTAALAKAVGK